MEKILTAFCFTDIHNQQAMLDYPATVRRSLVLATELAREEFGLADLAQYLVFEVNPDRVVFRIRNTGEYEGYHRDDKLKEYTVYLR